MSNPQQILQQTLSKWQSWQVEGTTLCSQPQVIRELSGGKTNRSFLVASGNFQAVVRVNAANSESLGIDRNREQKILQLLQHTGTVPRLFYTDKQAMVSAYCLGQHWMDTAENRRNLNAALAQIQAIAVADLEKRNYVNYCTAYINQLDQSLFKADSGKDAKVDCQSIIKALRQFVPVKTPNHSARKELKPLYPK